MVLEDGQRRRRVETAKSFEPCNFELYLLGPIIIDSQASGLRTCNFKQTCGVAQGSSGSI